MAIRSWIDGDKKEGFIAKKIVDQSVFKYGIHIPKNYHDIFLEVMDKEIPKGEGVSIELLIENKVFGAKIFNINAKERNDTTIQIRYDSNKELIDYLKEKFQVSYNYISANKVEGSKKSIDIPTELEEYIEFYYAEQPNTFKLELITKNIDEKVSAEVDSNNLRNSSDENMKEKFFQYIGNPGELGNGYQKSYKLVLLLQLLKLCNEKGAVLYNFISEQIVEFYNEIFQKHGKAESEDSEIQQKIHQLNSDIVKKVMNANAYKVINEKLFIEKSYVDGNEYLQFNPLLWNLLTSEDKALLKEILEEKLEIYYRDKVNITIDMIEDEGEEQFMEVNINTITENIHKYISSKGYFFDLDTIKNLYLSLKTKPFVILAGISGTGKSKLVELFAEALGATFNNNRYSLIPVRPDWSDPTDLLGYKNIEGKFQPGPLTAIIERAVNDKNNKPYFICLDEMNLARVEYYFSDILSVMETRKSENGVIKTQRLFKEELFGEDEEARNRFGNLYIPSNLYIIGTVNMDETTFPFSKKVLDRANTIEFNEVSLDINFEDISNLGNQEIINISNDLISSKYLKIIDCIHEKDKVQAVIEVLKTINKELVEMNLHFGYRVRDEVCFYVLYAIEDEIMDMKKALDHAILQKVLPRLQGNSISIKSILVNFFNEFNNGVIKADIHDNEISDLMKAHLNSENGGKSISKFPLTSYKIYKMVRRYELDGFTTFWE